MDPSKLRRPIVAACLFVGGLGVGSLQSERDIPSAYAAEPPKGNERKERSDEANATAKGSDVFAKGVESPALKSLRASVKRGGVDTEMNDVDPPAWGRSSLRSGPSMSRADASKEMSFARERNVGNGDPGIVTDPNDMFAGLRMPDFPVRRHPRVMRYLSYFAENHEGRRFFTEALRRMGRVQEIIARTSRELGLPQDLIALAFVESGFSPTAVSPAGAAGIWQFMPGTARAYGLVVERSFDERANPWKSTDAAMRHLSDLYERFRSLDLAMAAYNMGYEGLAGRMNELGSDDYWALADLPGALPKETAHYVPKVLAVAIILANLNEFGFGDVDRQEPIDASELEVPAGTRLAVIARAAGTSVRLLHDLNPELLDDAVPDRGGAVVLHVPREGLSRARVMLPRLINDPEARADREVSADFDWGRDDVGEGHTRREKTSRSSFFAKRDARKSRLPKRPDHDDDMSPLARFKARHLMGDRTPERSPSPDHDRDPNPDRNPDHDLDRNPDRATVPPPAPAPASPAAAPAQRTVLYRVSPSDTAQTIANTFGLSVGELCAQANVASPEALKSGMLIEVIPAPRTMSKLRETLPKQ